EQSCWEINDTGDPYMIARTSTAASYTGMRGLHIKSTPNGQVELNCLLNIEYSTSMLFEIYIFNLGTTAGIRIHFDGDNLNFYLDYGQHVSQKWDPGYGGFETGIFFPVDEWFHLESWLQDQIDLAFSYPNPHGRNFLPEYITRIEIFQRGQGYTTNENYFDEIKIFGGNLYSGPNYVYDQSDPENFIDRFQLIDLIALSSGSVFVIVAAIYYFRRKKLLKMENISTLANQLYPENSEKE
ncbi:MAG: hypothetical protein ACXAB7_20290, partial [Candidatus Kariarchaeaceae archaeon]